MLETFGIVPHGPIQFPSPHVQLSVVVAFVTPNLSSVCRMTKSVSSRSSFFLCDSIHTIIILTP